MKNKINLKNIFYYLQGNIRYYLYYSQFDGLIRNHIIEQIDARITCMDTTCYAQGSCKLCGCETTHLQMCNKSCEKPCYPAMVNKEDWKNFKQGEYTTQELLGWYYTNKKTFKKF